MTRRAVASSGSDGRVAPAPGGRPRSTSRGAGVPCGSQSLEAEAGKQHPARWRRGGTARTALGASRVEITPTVVQAHHPCQSELGDWHNSGSLPPPQSPAGWWGVWECSPTVQPCTHVSTLAAPRASPTGNARKKRPTALRRGTTCEVRPTRTRSSHPGSALSGTSMLMPGRAPRQLRPPLRGDCPPGRRSDQDSGRAARWKAPLPYVLAPHEPVR